MVSLCGRGFDSRQLHYIAQQFNRIAALFCSAANVSPACGVLSPLLFDKKLALNLLKLKQDGMIVAEIEYLYSQNFKNV